NLERQAEDFERRNYNFIHGAGPDSPGIVQLTHQLQLKTRERGRAWRQVAPAGPLDDAGRRAVTITSPSPHGLEADTVVYVFEAGKPNPADPAAGQQYLGEFRVVESNETGVVL